MNRLPDDAFAAPHPDLEKTLCPRPVDTTIWRMNRSLSRAAALLGALALLAGCTSLSNSLFLVSKVEGPLKAKAVTEQGIERYQLYLVSQGDYARVDEVRRYFVVALRYDPDNLKAQQYLERGQHAKAQEIVEKMRLVGVTRREMKVLRSITTGVCRSLAMPEASPLNFSFRPGKIRLGASRFAHSAISGFPALYSSPRYEVREG